MKKTYVWPDDVISVEHTVNVRDDQVGLYYQWPREDIRNNKLLCDKNTPAIATEKKRGDSFYKSYVYQKASAPEPPEPIVTLEYENGLYHVIDTSRISHTIDPYTGERRDTHLIISRLDGLWYSLTGDFIDVDANIQKKCQIVGLLE